MTLLPYALSVCLLTHCSVAEQPAPVPRGPEAATRQAKVVSLDELIGKTPGDNSLFRHYDPAGEVQWNNGWPGRVDLSGVAWDSPRTATAITPRHVVMAAHYPRQIGDTLVFHDRGGRRHPRTLLKTVSLRAEPTKTDIMVGLLDRPLPDQIKTYPLLEPRTDYADRLAGGPVLVTDQTRHLFVHEIMFVNEKDLRFTRSPESPPAIYKNLIKGDSGNPSFLVLEGGPVLVETHSMGGPGVGPFYSTPTSFAGIEKAARNLDPKYKVRTRALDANYIRLATERRAARKVYLTTNTDGLSKNAPKPGVVPASKTNPGSPTPPPPKETPPPWDPRVRRVPAAKST